MGILNKNKKSPAKSAFTPTSTSNMYKINGSKKASYCIDMDKDIESSDSNKKNGEKLADQGVIYHENPAFEPENNSLARSTNPFEHESFLRNDNNEAIQLASQNPTSLSSLASINNTEKLAAAAAAAVSSTAASVVEIPNFGQELSTMMQQNRMDEVEIGSKKGDSAITQTHGFTFGEGSNPTKMRKSPSSNAIGDLATLDDDAKLKLTGSSSSYDIKIRQRRACHLKVLIVLIAMLTAGFIGCIFTYYFMRYQVQNEKYLSYTENMVLERASKVGSNKLEILVPFKTNVTDLNDKSIIVNKIEEIVLQTFLQMNKSVDSMQLFELSEVGTNSYLATIDVELRDAREFSDVILVKENDRRIKIGGSSEILKTFRNEFLNITLSSNLNPESLTIIASEIDILYDFKAANQAKISTEVLTSTSSLLKTLIEESTLKNRVMEETKLLKSDSSVVEINNHFSVSVSVSTSTSTPLTSTSTNPSSTSSSSTTISSTTPATTTESTIIIQHEIEAHREIFTTTKIATKTTATTTTTASTTTATTTTTTTSTTTITTTTTTITATTESTKTVSSNILLSTVQLETVISYENNEKTSTETVFIPTTKILEQEKQTTGIFSKVTHGVNRILSTTINVLPQTSQNLKTDFVPKETESESIQKESKNESTNLIETEIQLRKDEENVVETNTNKNNEEVSAFSTSTVTTESQIDELIKNKVLIADIILNNDDDSKLDSKLIKTIEIEPNFDGSDAKINEILVDTSSSTSLPVIEEQSKNNHDFDIVLQIDGSDTNILSRFLQKINRKK